MHLFSKILNLDNSLANFFPVIISIAFNDTLQYNVAKYCHGTSITYANPSVENGTHTPCYYEKPYKVTRRKRVHGEKGYTHSASSLKSGFF